MSDETRPDSQDAMPPIEDAAEPREAPQVGAPDDEARAAALSLEARALDGGTVEAGPGESGCAEPASAALIASMRGQADDEGVSDTGRIVDEPAPTGLESSRFRKGEWQQEYSAHRIAAELRRIEVEVRQLLEDRDPKRKRKFGGTRRWHELEEDLITLRFTGRVDEDAIRQALRLIARRHSLFGQLRFVASTRPTWNT